MSVYVDNARHKYGRMIMCHMWADTREELFEMANKLGLQLRWFQRPPNVDLPGMDASWEHFDIATSKRALAIRFGAIQTDKYGPIEHTARLRGDTKMLERIASNRAKGFGQKV
ncbi:MAG: DUF4031 domain-containing protein [Hoeflea sp.]|uniref:DUF4031 domain-containing protein n=1 Tax=Hoeflea sp. TaxID=1940281 RepID=UPI0032ED95A5